ncbi:MAG: DUF2281 domain-containing protein [Proteobacteria bacterium]|nr:DUF2281 domain-containing protein [Pseudomonadota bacterium]NDF00486.1 DUF2281 domain-containing protein [Verrucomicrobiota bacterium]
MSTAQLIQREIEQAPEPVLREVYHYLCFLKTRADDEGFDGLAWSESSLTKDWNTPEEDAAWASL